MTSVRKGDRPQSWYEKETRRPQKPRKTTTSKGGPAENEANVVNSIPNVEVQGRGWKKVSVKDSSRSMSARKGKNVSPAVVDIVFGRVTNPVADVDKLHRKREEDTLKCGRTLQSAGNSQHQSQSPLKPINSSKEEDVGKEVEAKMRSDISHPADRVSAIPILPSSK